MVILFILISFLFSVPLSIFTFTKTKNKWIALLVTFCWNTVFLVGVTWIIYLLNDEVRLFGIGHTSFYILPFFIPLITWIDYFIIELTRKNNKKVDSI
ncbi:hypothetical protein KGR20_22430 [Cytobacillus oceanisediminis]|uniref:NADH dehydrogenase subunit 4 n=1 Tax=Niallia alba TaxID=2729105 RepID=A0A7Y0PQA6_9BACI|nr:MULTISPECIES: hypothetical protein [Bacillaceae]EOR24751.1 hypothetical protein A499_07160 [Niallia nealsonii AAU1]MDU1848514.1 hypothetical protein [Niallia nealsonii]MBZ9536919.1 hypothetical protein [Cytobacillus oceanisediminis]NMO79339.1 hypothetical protein [Niallia alba]UTI42650.1 hypothetical protein NKG37_02525 [Niallia sp. RD1]